MMLSCGLSFYAATVFTENRQLFLFSVAPFAVMC